MWLSWNPYLWDIKSQRFSIINHFFSILLPSPSLSFSLPPFFTPPSSSFLTNPLQLLLTFWSSSWVRDTERTITRNASSGAGSSIGGLGLDVEWERIGGLIAWEGFQGLGVWHLLLPLRKTNNNLLLPAPLLTFSLPFTSASTMRFLYFFSIFNNTSNMNQSPFQKGNLNFHFFLYCLMEAGSELPRERLQNVLVGEESQDIGLVVEWEVFNYLSSGLCRQKWNSVQGDIMIV